MILTLNTEIAAGKESGRLQHPGRKLHWKEEKPTEKMQIKQTGT